MNSRPALSSAIKIQTDHSQTGYRPMELCDKSVYELARCGETMAQIANFFQVTQQAVLEHHHVAYLKGAADIRLMPRRIAWKMLQDLEELVEKQITAAKNHNPEEDGAFPPPIDKAMVSMVGEWSDRAAKYMPEGDAMKAKLGETDDQLKAKIIELATKLGISNKV